MEQESSSSSSFKINEPHLISSQGFWRWIILEMRSSWQPQAERLQEQGSQLPHQPTRHWRGNGLLHCISCMKKQQYSLQGVRPGWHNADLYSHELVQKKEFGQDAFFCFSWSILHAMLFLRYKQNWKTLLSRNRKPAKTQCNVFNVPCLILISRIFLFL